MTGWENSAEVVDSSTLGANVTPAVEASVHPTQGQLTGKDFINETFPSVNLVSQTVLRVNHFGHTSATLVLDEPTSDVEILFKTPVPDQLYPIVTMTVTGDRQTFKVMDSQPVNTNKLVDKPLLLSSGKYVVLVKYVIASDPSKRPPLDIHTITFH